MNKPQEAARPNVDVIPFLSLPYFNDIVNNQFDLYADDQKIDTFTSCGLDFLIASTCCRYPLATCVALLSQLAYSESTLRDLGESGLSALVCNLDSLGQIVTTIMVLPESRPETHIQFVIDETSAYVVLPSFFHWTPDETSQQWLREKIVKGILEHTPTVR